MWRYVAMKKTIIEMLEEVGDPRRGNGIQHKLHDILMIGILTIISNGNTYVGGYGVVWRNA